MGKRYSKTNGVVVGGISAALVILSLYGGIFVRTGRITFMVLATFISAFPYMRGGIAAGLTTYAASAILGLILISNKLYAGVYAFFGIYPLIKLLSEKNKMILEFFYKYLWFNMTLGVNYFLYRNLISLNNFFYSLEGGIVFVATAEITFFIYDYVFTKFIMYVQDRFFRNKNAW